MGIELELGVLLGMFVVGESIFGPFEVETPAWRKILKWAVVVGLTLTLYQPFGHLALAVPLGLGGLGTAFHFVWCAKNEIHPFHATPRRRYYELRGWEWAE